LFAHAPRNIAIDESPLPNLKMGQPMGLLNLLDEILMLPISKSVETFHLPKIVLGQPTLFLKVWEI
jgi:hypothetical protein